MDGSGRDGIGKRHSANPVVDFPVVDFPVADQQDETQRWKAIETFDIFRDSNSPIALRRDIITRGDGAGSSDTASRLIAMHPGSVVVLAIDDCDRVVCLRQYRHTLRKRCIELPAGIRDVDVEDPLTTAQRELREEAGLLAEDWELMLQSFASPGWSDEAVWFFVARGLTEIVDDDYVRRHEEADMEVFRLPFEVLLSAVLTGAISNSQLCIAIMRYQLRS